jgi:hypothetical protein
MQGTNLGSYTVESCWEHHSWREKRIEEKFTVALFSLLPKHWSGFLLTEVPFSSALFRRMPLMRFKVITRVGDSLFTSFLVLFPGILIFVSAWSISWEFLWIRSLFLLLRIECQLSICWNWTDKSLYSSRRILILIFNHNPIRSSAYFWRLYCRISISPKKRTRELNSSSYHTPRV